MGVTFDDIRKQFELEAERAGRRELESPDDLPVTYDDITPAWLTAVLGGVAPGAEVVAHQLGDASEGTSSRRRIFLTWNEAGAGAGMPSSVFCKSTMSLASRYILGLNGGIAAEATFFDAIRPGLPIHTQEALFARYDPTSFNSISILRDMTGQVEFGEHAMHLSLPRARSQMRQLAVLHARYYDSAELGTALAAFNDWEDYFTITVDKAGFGPACERGVLAAEAVIPARLFARASEIWPATLRCVDDNRRLPRTLIHSDGHLKNWYLLPDDEMGLTDWQCASKGTWGRDVAYVVATALSVEDRRRWERDLVDYYLDQLHAAGGPRLDPGEAWTIYRQQFFAALAWWTGTLGQPPDAPKMQPQDTSIEFITRITAAIDDLDALDAWG